MPKSATPFFMTLKLIVITPAISMAPQKEISPSPSGYDQHQIHSQACIRTLIKLTGEVQVPTTKFGSFHVNWEKHFAASTKIFNIAVATLLPAR